MRDGRRRETAEGLALKLRQGLRRDRRVLFAYLHGSVLRRQDARDVDVAVYLRGRGEPWRLAQEIADGLERSLGYARRLDVHALNAAAVSFAFEVLRTGRLLWEGDKEARWTWEAHTLSRYQDFKPVLDFYDRKFLAR